LDLHPVGIRNVVNPSESVVRQLKVKVVTICAIDLVRHSAHRVVGKSSSNALRLARSYQPAGMRALIVRKSLEKTAFVILANTEYLGHST
jgi:hypothetical protein